MRKTAIVLAALFLSAHAHAQRTPPAEPTERPDWAAVRSAAEAAIKPTLFDPASAQIEWTSGFEWGSVKPVIGARKWGWVGCLSLNAKNRMGGYVGAETYWVLYKPDRSVTFASKSEYFSQCDTPGKAPVQPQLVAVQNAGAPSVADELTKLASLLERGVITREEFDAQKAKLLQQ